MSDEIPALIVLYVAERERDVFQSARLLVLTRSNPPDKNVFKSNDIIVGYSEIVTARRLV